MTVDSVGGRKALAALSEVVVRRGQARALAGLVPVLEGAEAAAEAGAADLTEAVA